MGYNAIWVAPTVTEVAIVNLGYADGYRRAFSGVGGGRDGDHELPVIGRVSMDLIAIDVTAAANVAEADWISIDYQLPRASEASGISQYELLAGLGRRSEHCWSC